MPAAPVIQPIATRMMLLEFLWRLARPTTARPIRLPSMKQKLKNRPSSTVHPLLVAKSKTKNIRLIKVDSGITKVATNHKYSGLFRNDQRDLHNVDSKGSVSREINLEASLSSFAMLSSLFPVGSFKAENSVPRTCPLVHSFSGKVFKSSSCDGAVDEIKRVVFSSV